MENSIENSHRHDDHQQPNHQLSPAQDITINYPLENYFMYGSTPYFENPFFASYAQNGNQSDLNFQNWMYVDPNNPGDTPTFHDPMSYFIPNNTMNPYFYGGYSNWMMLDNQTPPTTYPIDRDITINEEAQNHLAHPKTSADKQPEIITNKRKRSEENNGKRKTKKRKLNQEVTQAQQNHDEANHEMDTQTSQLNWIEPLTQKDILDKLNFRRQTQFFSEETAEALLTYLKGKEPAFIQCFPALEDVISFYKMMKDPKEVLEKMGAILSQLDKIKLLLDAGFTAQNITHILSNSYVPLAESMQTLLRLIGEEVIDEKGNRHTLLGYFINQGFKPEKIGVLLKSSRQGLPENIDALSSLTQLVVIDKQGHRDTILHYAVEQFDLYGVQKRLKGPGKALPTQAKELEKTVLNKIITELKAALLTDIEKHQTTFFKNSLFFQMPEARNDLQMHHTLNLNEPYQDNDITVLEPPRDVALYQQNSNGNGVENISYSNADLMSRFGFYPDQARLTSQLNTHEPPSSNNGAFGYFDDTDADREFILE